MQTHAHAYARKDWKISQDYTQIRENKLRDTPRAASSGNHLRTNTKCRENLRITPNSTLASFHNISSSLGPLKGYDFSFFRFTNVNSA